MSDDVVIIGGARTPFCEWVGGKRGDGKPGGLLKDYSALKLGEIAIKGALEKTNTSPEDVNHVVMGYALQTCGQAIFGARHAGRRAGGAGRGAGELHADRHPGRPAQQQPRAQHGAGRHGRAGQRAAAG